MTENTLTSLNEGVGDQPAGTVRTRLVARRRALLAVDPGRVRDLDRAADCDCACHPQPGSNVHGDELCPCQLTPVERRAGTQRLTHALRAAPVHSTPSLFSNGERSGMVNTAPAATVVQSSCGRGRANPHHVDRRPGWVRAGADLPVRLAGHRLRDRPDRRPPRRAPTRPAALHDRRTQGLDRSQPQGTSQLRVIGTERREPARASGIAAWVRQVRDAGAADGRDEPGWRSA